jgi:hypothetical protein
LALVPYKKMRGSRFCFVPGKDDMGRDLPTDDVSAYSGKQKYVMQKIIEKDADKKQEYDDAVATRSKDVLRAYVNSQVPKNATYAWAVVASKRAWKRNSDYVKRQLAELLRMPESRARRAELDKLGAGNEFHDEIPMPYNVPPGSRERLPPIRTPERLPLITSRERLPLITSTAVGRVLELGDAAYGPASLAAAPCAFAAASGPAPAAPGAFAAASRTCTEADSNSLTFAARRPDQFGRL